MKFTLYLSLLLFSAPAFASVCGPSDAVMSRVTVTCLVKELIDESFPELRDAYLDERIQIKEFNSKDYYLKTSLKNRKNYSIDINPRLFEPKAPTLAALKGILAHELVHLADYETYNVLQMIDMGIGLFFSPSDYERYTDERAFERGFACEIREYRNWIYTKLNSSELKRKKKRYYTPDEIDQWLKDHSRQCSTSITMASVSSSQ